MGRSGNEISASVIFSHSPGGAAAPLWLANLTENIQQIQGDIQQIQGDVAQLLQKAEELPILLINSQAGHRGTAQSNCHG